MPNFMTEMRYQTTYIKARLKNENRLTELNWRFAHYFQSHGLDLRRSALRVDNLAADCFEQALFIADDYVSGQDISGDADHVAQDVAEKVREIRKARPSADILTFCRTALQLTKLVADHVRSHIEPTISLEASWIFTEKVTLAPPKRSPKAIAAPRRVQAASGLERT